MSILTATVGFDWDRGNRSKCQKHGTTIEVIESFFRQPIILLPDETHSEKEPRYRAIGRASSGRPMFVVFTLRNYGGKILIRPVSARYMHKKEIEGYEKEENSKL